MSINPVEIIKRAFLQNSAPLRVPHLFVYRSSGCVPYLIPVGGSNPVGSWGYIEAFRELMEQVRSIPINTGHCVCVCVGGGGKGVW